MISTAHVKALLTGGLTRALADLYFNNPKTFMNSGANGGSVSATVGQIATAHAAFPDASQNWLFNSLGPNELTGAPGIDGVFGPGGMYGPGTTLPPYLASVSYDPEGSTSNGTPQSECDALEEGDLSDVTQAALLVHARGLKFLFTPSVDVGMSGSQARPYPNKYSTYLSQRRGAWAATPGIDVFAIQSQQAEGTPLYGSFVASALAQAHAAAPSVPVLVGLGINPHNPPTAISTPMLVSAFELAQADGAAGYWQNVETGNANVPPSVYSAFFDQLQSLIH